MDIDTIIEIVLVRTKAPEHVRSDYVREAILELIEEVRKQDREEIIQDLGEAYQAGIWTGAKRSEAEESIFGQGAYRKVISKYQHKD
jgi:Arc/MetJ-type ribon-helix-helix transcriptional regulator